MEKASVSSQASISASPRSVKRYPVYSQSEIAKHNHRNDAWVVVDGHVYDVTRFLPYHPGGLVLETQLGRRDATDVFDAFHPPQKRDSILKRFRIGRAESDQTAEFTRDYRLLREKFLEMGLFDGNLWYWAMKMCLNLSFLAASIFFAPSTSLLGSALSGLMLALFWQQMAFIAHDSLHNGVFHSPRLNYWLGFFCGTVCFGMSATQWKDEHNVHHAITNQVHDDLQFTYLPVWLLDEKELLVGKGKNLGSLAKFLIRLQAWTFLPLCLMFGRINIIRMTLTYSLGWDEKREEWKTVDWIELAGIAVHLATLVGVTYLVPTRLARAVFLAVALIFVGILHIQLSVSHMATEMFMETEQEDLEFFRFQMRSTRNIDSNVLTHWFHGGLQFQIEHHLFPMMPRHNLEYAKKFVQELCRKHEIQYSSIPFLESVVECVTRLQMVSKTKAF